jgi:hypothetical protein
MIAALTLGLAGVLGGVTTQAASAGSQLSLISSGLQYESCQIYGQLGQRGGWWTVWWCSHVQPYNPNGYELWAYRV